MAAMDPKSAVRSCPLRLTPNQYSRETPSIRTQRFLSFEQLSDPLLGVKSPLPMDPHLSGRVLTQIRTGILTDEQLTP